MSSLVQAKWISSDIPARPGAPLSAIVGGDA